MQSRLIHFVMEVSFTEWLEDVAIKEGYDSRLIAFLSMYPKYLMDFRPDHQEKTFCCPRKHTALHERNLMSKAA